MSVTQIEANNQSWRPMCLAEVNNGGSCWNRSVVDDQLCASCKPEEKKERTIVIQNDLNGIPEGTPPILACPYEEGENLFFRCAEPGCKAHVDQVEANKCGCDDLVRLQFVTKSLGVIAFGCHRYFCGTHLIHGVVLPTGNVTVVCLGCRSAMSLDDCGVIQEIKISLVTSVVLV